MQRINKSGIENLPRRYRTQLINSLSGFKSVNLVGTISKDGVTNLSVVSSVVHLGANPAIMGFIMRPVSVQRDTYQNIQETGYFTFNHITADFYKAAHQASARYDAEVSEFSATGLTPAFKNDFQAPYVKESPVQVGLNFTEAHQIETNKTILIIGTIQEIYYPEDCLDEDGYLDIEAAGSITCSSLDSYHSTKRLARLTYAKPDQEVKEMSIGRASMPKPSVKDE